MFDLFSRLVPYRLYTNTDHDSCPYPLKFDDRLKFASPESFTLEVVRGNDPRHGVVVANASVVDVFPESRKPLGGDLGSWLRCAWGSMTNKKEPRYSVPGFAFTNVKLHCGEPMTVIVYDSNQEVVSTHPLQVLDLRDEAFEVPSLW